MDSTPTTCPTCGHTAKQAITIRVNLAPRGNVDQEFLQLIRKLVRRGGLGF